MTLIYLGIAWLAGIFLSSLLNLPALFLTLVGLVPLVSLVLWRENPRVRLLSVCALALVISLLLDDVEDEPSERDDSPVGESIGETT